MRRVNATFLRFQQIAKLDVHQEIDLIKEFVDPFGLLCPSLLGLSTHSLLEEESDSFCLLMLILDKRKGTCASVFN